MTTKRIVFARLDGGVSVTVPDPDYMAILMADTPAGQGLTEAQALASVQARSVPGDATNIEIMEVATIPNSREFRNAWEKPGAGAPTINMTKARVIHAERIGQAKITAFSTLARDEEVERIKGNTVVADVMANKRTASGAINIAEIAAQIANAPNPMVLSAIWPNELDDFR